MNELSVQQLQEQLKQGEQWYLLDVRQPDEFRICNLSHVGRTMLAPLNTLPGRLQDIPANQPVVVYCHHGIRSQYAIEYLQQHGFSQLYNLSGGIHAWAQEVEPQMTQY